MRRLLFTTAIFLSLGLSGFAQGGSGDGKAMTAGAPAATTQSGYAVITPANIGTELTVMETFGQQTPDVVTAAGFAAPDLITVASIFVDVAGRLERNLALAIANPNPGDATITFTLRRDDGTYLGARTFSMPPHTQFDKFITELIPIEAAASSGGPLTPVKEYTGTLSIISNVPISVLGLRFRGSMFSTLPVTNYGTSSPLPSLSLEVGGPSAILLPQFATDGGWATQLVITNPSTFKAVFRVDLFKGDGSPMTATLNGTTGSSFVDLSVPPGGVLVLSPRDAKGDHRF